MSAKKKETAAPEAPKAAAAPKAVAGVVERPISKDELIQLQIDGKLKGYNPATGMGKVASVGKKIIWPGGNPKVV